ncbi:LysE family translocator [Streptomyces shenzhenensis]|uniref:LysE family translocator n=1 Tax=Streptomyces shenzhenensis TaxID=943815 RepID=UPI003828FDEF
MASRAPAARAAGARRGPGRRVLIVVPGPSVLFVIGRALAHGRRAALTTVVGNTLGACVLVVAVALGVGTVVERSVVVFTALKLAGAAYLVRLGVKAWRQRGALKAAFAADEADRGGLRTPISASPPTPPTSESRRGERANQSRAVAAASPHTLSEAMAITSKTSPSSSIWAGT